MPDVPKYQQLHAIVHGRVQGVSFRYYTVQEARSLGLVGWVRNRSDGTVEAVVEGERARLAQLVGFLRRGPPSARVSAVDIEWGPAAHDFSHFAVRYYNE